MKNIGFLALSFISISCFAALKPPHDSTSYNRVIGNVNHEVGRADAIGFDDSSGEFNNGSESGGNAPTAPDVDLITPPVVVPPPVVEVPPPPTSIKLNCGCARVWLKSDGAGPSSTCFNPKRAKTDMDRRLSGYWSSSYGTFWPNVDEIDFVGTFDIRNPSSPILNKVELQYHSGRKDVTSHIRSRTHFAFTAPRMDVGNASCTVKLIDPARTYITTTYTPPSRGCTLNYHYQDVKPGNHSVKLSNVSSNSPGLYRYEKQFAECFSGWVAKKYYY